MEDGNLIDKVNILIQRDMEYYTVGRVAQSICELLDKLLVHVYKFTKRLL